MAADFTQFLAQLRRDRGYRSQVVHEHRLPPRQAQYADLSRALPDPLRAALATMGIERLYTHQVEAIEHLRGGRNVVIVTSTASGKTLCYNLPVLECLLAEPQAKAFYLFPTKALAQDQLRGLRRFAESHPDLAEAVKCGTYDGDTPGATRRRLRESASLILTNPDMLHQGILPYHSRWHRFFSDLRYVVVDEIHTYRGIFGSHVANVLRRLLRICRHYGSQPQFVCSSATIANPRELAERLTGADVVQVDRDGSPKGPKQFLLWNPPFFDAARMERRSGNDEAKDLMVRLIGAGIQTIAFTRTRLAAELIYRYASEALAKAGPGLGDSIRAYRGGYLPEERREIERRLFSGDLMGVTSTNALELGIDVGSLDACLIVGYPGTIASTWQQAGRAGRGADEALAVLIGYNDPIDQYLMRHPDYFFGQSPENAVVDPQNPYVLAGHLRCAAFELPLSDDDRGTFGELTPEIAGVLEKMGQLERLDDRWYWSSIEYPAAQVNLRTSSDDTFTIMDQGNGNAVIGVVDSISAPELVYPEAVYLHQGETYLVRRLDLEGRAAYVERQGVDYYTQAILDSHIRVEKPETEKDWQGCRVCFGDATVTWQTTGFKKIRFHSLDSIGWGKLDLPAQSLETTAAWLIPSAEALGQVTGHGRKPVEGLCGIRNVAVQVLPLFAMCDRQDLGGIVDSSNTGSPTIFLYDRYPGGLGFAEKGFELIEDLAEACLSLIEECECEQGCPSCVGSPVTRPPIHADPDLMAGYPVPDKEAALVILHHLLGKAPYVPKGPPPGEREEKPSATDAAALGRRVADRVRKSRTRKRSGL
jgi:DEAD/DEAH box helicase domain-containing protein